MATALVKFVQGATVGVAGQSLFVDRIPVPFSFIPLVVSVDERDSNVC
jgi:hypothetical protein